MTFVVESDDCESILQRLTAAGFGRFADTSIRQVSVNALPLNSTDNICVT